MDVPRPPLTFKTASLLRMLTSLTCSSLSYGTICSGAGDFILSQSLHSFLNESKPNRNDVVKTYSSTLLARSERYRVKRSKKDCISTSNACRPTGQYTDAFAAYHLSTNLPCALVRHRRDETTELIAHCLRCHSGCCCFEVDMASHADARADRLACGQ